MNSTSYALLVTFAVVGTLSILPAFAQSPIISSDEIREEAMLRVLEEIPVIVQTDQQTYNHESVIMVEGNVGHMKSGVPVTVTVFSPTNNLVGTRQLQVTDNTFETTFNTAGDFWKYDGIYTIRVQYGASTDKTTVELIDGITREIPMMTQCDPNEFQAAEQCIPYTITGGMVTSGAIDQGSMSIVVMIDATDDGTFTMRPAPGVIEGTHTILVNGEPWDDVIIDGNEITVMFLADTERIDVIGTRVIPEFGTIAVLILGGAIISIIAITSRSRLSIMPKY